MLLFCKAIFCCGEIFSKEIFIFNSWKESPALAFCNSFPTHFRPEELTMHLTVSRYPHKLGHSDRISKVCRCTSQIFFILFLFVTLDLKLNLVQYFSLIGLLSCFFTSTLKYLLISGPKTSYLGSHVQGWASLEILVWASWRVVEIKKTTFSHFTDAQRSPKVLSGYENGEKMVTFSDVSDIWSYRSHVDDRWCHSIFLKYVISCFNLLTMQDFLLCYIVATITKVITRTNSLTNIAQC